MDKGLELKKLSEVVKALEDGKTIDEYTPQGNRIGVFQGIDLRNPNYFQDRLRKGYFYRIKPEPKKFVLYGSVGIDFKVQDRPYGVDDLKITFELDENNKPVCDSIKMEEIK